MDCCKMSISIIEVVTFVWCPSVSANWLIDNGTIRLTLWKIREGKQSENNDNFSIRITISYRELFQKNKYKLN